MSLPLPVTVRGWLFAGTLAMSALVTALGSYAYVSIEDAGEIVAYTYDRPLMAINFARSSSQLFSNLRLKARNAEDAIASGNDPDIASIVGVAETFLEDIAVVRERALSDRARLLAAQAADEMLQWSSDLRAGVTVERLGQLNAIAPAVALKLNTIVELQAGEAYRERARAEEAIETTRLLTVAATGAALILTLLISTVLSARIVRPLREAATAADRIAAGELETRIPSGSRDETGALLRSMSYMQTSIRDALGREKSLRESAQIRLIEALETSVEGIVLLNADGAVALLNSRMRTFFPELVEQLSSGVAFSKLVRPDGTPVSGMDSKAGPVNEDGEFKMTDGRWLRVSRSTAPDGSIFIVWSDVTHAKEREAAYLQARDRAEEASESKSRFLRNMSHELRTPLNAVIGFSEIIRSETLGAVGNNQYKEYANEINGSGHALLTVINSVLSIAEGSKIAPEDGVPINLMDIAEDCVDLCFEEARAAQIKMGFAGSSSSLLIKGDEKALREAVQNILSNAIKFNNAGGRVEISSAANENGFVDLIIADTGIGMSAEEVEIALEPFGQVDGALSRKYEGSGLGLPLAKSIVEAHGGTLFIEGAAGQGTRVCIRLPHLESHNQAAVM